jgi:hypothetical protein
MYMDNTGRCIIFSVITSIYNKQTKRPSLMEFFTATVKLKKKFDCNYQRLTARIIAVVKNIDAPMLARAWQELEYLIDVCRVTRGANIEHF